MRPGIESVLSEQWQGFSAQWARCLFWLCDFPFGINDFFDGSEDAFCSRLILALFKTGAVRVL